VELPAQKEVIFMKRHVLRALRAGSIVLAALIVVVFVGVGSSFAVGPPTRGLSTFSDGAGDGEGGPDITQVQVHGVGDTGSLYFFVTAKGMPEATPGLPSSQVHVRLDTDGDGGSNYWLYAATDDDGMFWGIDRWSGGDWEYLPVTGDFQRFGDVFRWDVDTSEIGDVRSFGVRAYAGTWDFSDLGNALTMDVAPEANADGTMSWWQYTLPEARPPGPTVRLSVGAPVTSPKAPAAGKRFTVAFPASFEVMRPGILVDPFWGEIEVETGVISVVSTGSMVCDPSVAGKVITHTESFRNGQAQLVFVVPKSAKGKLLKVNVRITATERDTHTTRTTSRTATFRVR
jgi:hypothetical protein